MMASFGWHDIVWREAGWAVAMPDGLLPIVLADGGPVLTWDPGWRPRGFLSLTASLGIVHFSHGNGGFAVWFLQLSEGRELRFVGREIQAIPEAMLPEFNAAILRILRAVLTDPVGAFRDLEVQALLRIEEPLRRVLLDRGSQAAPSPVSFRLPDLRDAEAAWADEAAEGFGLSLSAVNALLRVAQPQNIDAWFVSGDPPQLRALDDSAEVELRYVPWSRHSGVFLARHAVTNRLDAALIWQGGRLRLIVPQSWAFFVGPGDDGAWMLAEAGRLVNDILAGGQTFLAWWLGPVPDPALMFWPAHQTHIGHFIWNEMHSLDRVLSAGARNVPVYALAFADGCSFYGPMADLYPECRIITSARTEGEAIRHAMQHRIQPLPTIGQRALSASRRRIGQVIAADPDIRLMSDSVTRLAVDPPTGGRRPVLALGLRLHNRTPVDTFGVYARLTRYLYQRFGSLSVVLDGLNRQPGQPANRSLGVYNLTTNNAPVSLGLEDELTFAERFRSELATLPITIVSCIGTTVPANLAWLSVADFFVAPHGAGLAKLRWALDKPGFVLSSRANIQLYSYQHIYDSERWMEPPLTPLSFTTFEDVEDVAGDKPDGAARAITRVPYPDNFRVNEDRLFPRIADAMRAAIDALPLAPGEPP